MSAYIVEPEHIAYLGNACSAFKIAIKMDEKIYSTLDPQVFGQNLLNSNVGCVSTIYANRLFTVWKSGYRCDLPGSYEPPYEYKHEPAWVWDGQQCTPFQVFKSAECFSHQCDGIDQWDGSIGHAFMSTLQHVCLQVAGLGRFSIMKTKEYERAIWGAPGPEVTL